MTHPYYLTAVAYCRAHRIPLRRIKRAAFDKWTTPIGASK
jgi:hypothetical protein